MDATEIGSMGEILGFAGLEHLLDTLIEHEMDVEALSLAEAADWEEMGISDADAQRIKIHAAAVGRLQGRPLPNSPGAAAEPEPEPEPELAPSNPVGRVLAQACPGLWRPAAGRSELPVRDTPAASAPEVGVLAAGELLRGLDTTRTDGVQGEWLQVNAGGLVGWVAMHGDRGQQQFFPLEWGSGRPLGGVELAPLEDNDIVVRCRLVRAPGGLSEPNPKEWWCVSCSVPLMAVPDTDWRQNHTRGAKHKKKLQQLMTAPAEHGPPVVACPCCGLTRKNKCKAGVWVNRADEAAGGGMLPWGAAALACHQQSARCTERANVKRLQREEGEHRRRVAEAAAAASPAAVHAFDDARLYKMQLNELSQAQGIEPPRYSERQLSEQLFEASVCLLECSRTPGVITGEPSASKKAAKESAAKRWCLRYSEAEAERRAAEGAVAPAAGAGDAELLAASGGDCPWDCLVCGRRDFGSELALATHQLGKTCKRQRPPDMGHPMDHRWKAADPRWKAADPTAGSPVACPLCGWRTPDGRPWHPTQLAAHTQGRLCAERRLGWKQGSSVPSTIV
jgi:hypothetical protein